MQRFFALATISVTTALAAPAAAQNRDFSDCVGLLFSTEEDFLTTGPEPADGNPVISDGDLLSWDPGAGTATVCARNEELLRPGVLVEVSQPLGLDAVDGIDPRAGMIAFSTELDEQFGLFGHGDVLFPDGTIIPNAVLVARFQLPDNMGLDAVQFIGETEAIVRAVKMAKEIGADQMREDPEAYLERLRELGVDIWFSLEGTPEPLRRAGILDGDLLSAASGSIVVPNAGLLNPPVPAGLIDRGVDFGLDAVTAERKPDRKSIRFSTEILYRGERTPFNDGDVLEFGGAVAVPNEKLIAGFDPRADFLGLDALSFVDLVIEGGDPHIDTLCGRDFAAADFGADGLWRANTALSPPGEPPRRPCGRFIPIDGTLPMDQSTSAGGMTRFRVVWESMTAPGNGDEIESNWRLKAPAPFWPYSCVWQPVSANLSTDGTDGWMNAKDFIDAYTGNINGITGDGSKGCANPHLQLAMWNTLALPADRQNDLVRVRLEWEVTGGTIVAEPLSYPVQLDNILPEMPTYPGGLEVRLNDGTGVKVPACGEAPTGQSEFQVWAEFADPHYWFFTLTVEGGDPPTTHPFLSPSGDSWHEYFEPLDDVALSLKNTDGTGTTPDSTLAHLRNIDMTELGSSFKRCCYLLRLRVYDAAIRHTFNGKSASTSLDLNDTPRITTFEAGG